MKPEKRGNSYRVQKTVEGRKYSLTFDHKPTKKEIDALLREKIAENPVVTSQNAHRKTFNECAEKYCSIKSNVISPSTMRSYKSMLNNMDEGFKSLQLSDIGQIEVQELVNKLALDHSPKYVRNYHAFVSAVLQTFNPDLALRTTLPQKIKVDDYVPTAEEVKKVLKIAEPTKYWVVFMLGCYGLRMSEILGLTMEDIDFETGIVHINKAMVYGDNQEWIIKPNKTTESTRDIIVSQDLLKRIKGQGNVYEGHPRKINENLESMQKKAGVPRFKFHSLRKFFATEVSRVLPEEDWLRLGGWSSPYVAKKVYRHNRIDAEISEKQKASDQISSLLG